MMLLTLLGEDQFYRFCASLCLLLRRKKKKKKEDRTGQERLLDLDGNNTLGCPGIYVGCPMQTPFS